MKEEEEEIDDKTTKFVKDKDGNLVLMKLETDYEIVDRLKAELKDLEGEMI